MIVAVTGASGRLGQWVTAALLREGHEVLALSRRPLTSPSIPGLAWRGPVRGLVCDLAEQDSVGAAREELARAGAVVHLAACVPPDTARSATEDAFAALGANALGTVHLLQALAEARGLRAVVHASTSEVYGAPRSLPIDEDHPTDPLGFYGASKLAAEKYVRLFGESRAVPSCSLRLPAVYGPGDRIRHIVEEFARAAARGEEIVIQGDGEDRRDLLYVADAAEAILSALQGRASGVLNAGSGSGVSLRETAEAAVRASGGASRVVLRGRAKPRLDDVLSIERIRETIGWRPRTSLEVGIRAAIDWIRRGG